VACYNYVMKKKIFIILILAIVASSYLFFHKWTMNEIVTSGNPELALYFQERLDTLGVNPDIGRPIEGLDADLLISAFPGLKPEDFENVETFEGHYELNNGSIDYSRDSTGPVSSAEKTVSKDGYKTLLNNVSNRVNIDMKTRTDIDRLIDIINTEDLVLAKIDQGGSAFGVKVIPVSILEDSRCAEDVVCIQAGTVKVKTLLTGKDGEITEVFELNQINPDFNKVILVRVEPQASSKTKIKDRDYIFYFNIIK